ncbi:ZBT34 protein, partial [Polypterus senegalus]|nr:zinc finger and BTB domain-containing protein 34 [Polypterus senegalus]MBN3292348.1 ZBT34 protein [Polypterus senegalus]
MDSSNSFIEFDVPEYSSTVLSQLNELRLQGKLCDIIVHIQGQPFRAHKAVLAASSPYFRDHSALSTMSGLSISVIKNPEVFEQLLSFCYTGRMSLQLKDVISFLTAASFLQMQAVIDKCTQILEGIHSKMSLPGGADTMLSVKESQQASRNGVKDGNLFVNPLEISPPYITRQTNALANDSAKFDANSTKSLRQRLQEEGQSDRGSSGSISEHENALEAEQEQMDIISRDGHVTDIKVKQEKADRPSCSDSSSAGDDGYHTELVDGDQVVAVSVGSFGPVLPHSAYAYPHLTSQSSSFVSLSSSSPSRSILSGFRGGRARPKRPLATVPSEVSNVIKTATTEDGETVMGSPGFENDIRERSMRGQWYPYNERLICIYCGKSFNQKGSLDRHMRLHMGITPFVCKFCGKKYTRKDQLEYHIRGHTDNKPFHCEICGKCFPFQGTLNQHLRKKHMGGAELRNHMESPDRTEGMTESKDSDEAAASDSHMEYSSQYSEESVLNNESNDSVKRSPQ